MKIASICNTVLDPTLGSGKTRLAWSNGLRALGHSVNVYEPTQFYKSWIHDKGRTIKFRIDALKLYGQLLAGNYDILEFYGAEFGALISRLARIPKQSRPLIVHHTDGLELLWERCQKDFSLYDRTGLLQRIGRSSIKPVIEYFDRLAFSQADAVIYQHATEGDYLIEHEYQRPETCSLVEPGVDEIYLSTEIIPNKKPRLVSLGTWTTRKDSKTLVEVASSLLSANPNLEFHILGAHTQRDFIINVFPDFVRNRINVYPRVTVEKISEVLAHSSIFLLPSLFEGFGMATTEAMACGCCVVVTPTGFGTAIKSGTDGFVCNFKDTDAMVSRCQSLLSDSSLCYSIAKAAKDRVSSLSWPCQILKLEKIYQGWVEAKGASSNGEIHTPAA